METLDKAMFQQGGCKAVCFSSYKSNLPFDIVVTQVPRAIMKCTYTNKNWRKLFKVKRINYLHTKNTQSNNNRFLIIRKKI